MQKTVNDEDCQTCPINRRITTGRRKSDQVDPRFKIAYMLSLQKLESVLLLAVAGLLLSLGFFLGKGSNENYGLIYDFASGNFWGTYFGIYTFFKFYSVWYHLDYRIKILNSIAGLWAWNYIFLSFAVFDSSPMAPTEILLLMPVITEMWVAMSAIHCGKAKR